MTPLEQKIVDRIKADERRIEDLEFAVRQLQQAMSAQRPKVTRSEAFVTPTIPILEEFFIEQGGTYEMARDFFDFYTSKKWMVGKNKMADWRAAARRWIRGNREEEPGEPDPKPEDIRVSAMEERTRRIIRERSGEKPDAVPMPAEIRAMIGGVKTI